MTTRTRPTPGTGRLGSVALTRPPRLVRRPRRQTAARPRARPTQHSDQHSVRRRARSKRTGRPRCSSAAIDDAPAVNGAWPRRRAGGVGERGDPDGRGHQRVAAVLDRAEPRPSPAVAGLGRAVERRVVGLHHEQLRAAGDRVADEPVVGDLEADHVPDGGRPDAQHARRVPGAKSVGDQVDLVADLRAMLRSGMYSRERHRVPFDVAPARSPVAGLPDEPGVLTAAAGPVRTAPTRIGAPTARAASSIASAASGLRSGSMSEEFSGHTTRSGAAAPSCATSCGRARRSPARGCPGRRGAGR